ncbi:Helix-turn-helix [Micromonospora sediminicola]|uniref:Helix-turn-helix n=1 Tax=Micromonospora sediminicola TaxID=946078 RepID=A0A1A9B4H6_9ACTN|nr:helix-turn-helix transcriptional regulator [Micromonospora sediminicola]SBT63961.1 Helix-turn-helix [Micromonospora sediminicola]
MTTSRGSRASAFIAVNGDAIREARKQRGLSIEQLATRVGVTKPYISKLELGHSLRCSVTVHASLVRILRPARSDAFRADKAVA